MLTAIHFLIQVVRRLGILARLKAFLNSVGQECPTYFEEVICPVSAAWQTKGRHQIERRCNPNNVPATKLRASVKTILCNGLTLSGHDGDDGFNHIAEAFRFQRTTREFAAQAASLK